MAHVVLVPWPEVGPDCLELEFPVQEASARVILTSEIINHENFHKGFHLNQRPENTKLPAAPRAGHLTETTSKTVI